MKANTESVLGLQVPPLQFAQMRISAAQSRSPEHKSQLRNTPGGPHRSSLLPGCHRGSAAPRRAGGGKREPREAGAGTLSNTTSAASGSELGAPRPALPSARCPGAAAGAAPCPPLSQARARPRPGGRAAAPPLPAAALAAPGDGTDPGDGGACVPRSIPGASLEHSRGHPGPCERGQERSARLRRAAREVIYVDGLARPAVLVGSLACTRI